MNLQRALPALSILAVVYPLVAGSGGARLRLRSGTIPDNLMEADAAVARTVRAGGREAARALRSHLVLQFAAPPGEALRIALEARQFRVLAYVPDNALLVSAPLDAALGGLGVIYAGVLSVENKFSPLFDRSAPEAEGSAVVEFHADVEPGEGRRLAAAEGLKVVENPDLPAESVLVWGAMGRLESLAGLDEVARVYPASAALLSGLPGVACRSGALALAGGAALPVSASLASSFGEGWDGPGLGAAELGYYLGRMTPALDAALTRAEIERALREWAAVVAVTFTESGVAGRNRQFDILFAERAHGDGQDFDGRGGVLAHTFYPPPNAETVAGDLHLDVEEPWRIGNDVDVFSVVLHELGHALGLGHNDDPDAVMYPYYRRSTMLHAPDVVEIRKLYGVLAAAPATPATPATPPVTPAAPAAPATPAPAPQPPVESDRVAPTLVITSPALSAVSTKSASYRVLGRASDNVGVVSVTWSNGSGGAGSAAGLAAFDSGPIPLTPGQNRITITARDAAGNATSRSVTVTRQ